MSRTSKTEPYTVRSIEYALTFSLKPNIYRNTIGLQLDMGERDINMFISDMKAEGLLLAELTPNANIHFHGLFVFNVKEPILKRIEFFVKDYFRKSKVIGFICMKPVVETIGWLQYMLKDYDITKELLERNPIRWNHTLPILSNVHGIMMIEPYFNKKQIEENQNIKKEER